jgi:hypothetical protein
MDGLTPDDVIQRLETLWREVAQPPQFRVESRDHAFVYGRDTAPGQIQRPGFSDGAVPEWWQ